ncbi:hypothetical protein DICVIV_05005 [Dictyocaulus viviparus]|uniref:Zasp-like motif domain-containing protein n=1 Tax=Dictyocaulus viviparus TaxID=29172 RepID=A0A0D8XYP5_DICVI|nr:hypothetical protein DICVIV_05005 [Dictyocaulus viviparus]
MGEVQLNDVWVPSAIASHFINEERVPFSYTKPNPNLINRPTKLDTSNADPVLPLVATTKNMAQPVHLQYNSPMPIYSREAAEEEYQHQLGGTSPIPMPVGDKHFDPEKSSTLKFIKEGNEGNFGEHFFEQIASAEAPKVYPRQEPEWAQCAREKSERARSRTPADPTHHYTPSTTPLSTHHHEYQHNETPREFMEKSRTFTHTNRPQYGPSYHQTQSFQRRRGHSEPRETRGYECGGLDYTKGLYFPSVHYDQYYENRSNSLRRASDATNVRPGYEMGGTDFGKGYVAPGPYRGHGPDPPRLRPRYSADPRSPCNSYYAPNVDEVDANLLVGDTISNQKIRHEVRHINQNEFGTSFAPPPGFKRDHITLRRSPQPPEPITFSLSANKSRYGGSVSNILNHSRQTPMWRQPTAQETRETSIHHPCDDDGDGVAHPAEIFINEPNWSRTVKERRNAWERKAFDRETHLDRQQFGKVYHSQQSPAWYSKAERTHNAWRQAADRMNTEGVHPHPEQQHFESSQTTYHQSGGAQPYQSHSYHDDHKQHQQQEHQNSPIQSHITSQHSESYKVAQSVPTHQTHITSGLANGNNADLQLNTGYNMNQADYIRDHFDKYRAGPRYGSSHF